MLRLRPLWLTLLVVSVLAHVDPGVLATKVLPLNLEQMVNGSARIFVGRCADVHVTRSGPFKETVVEITVVVERALKGSTDSRFTFRMLEPTERELAIAPGEAVVLLLYPESDLGFTSPIGLGQGILRLYPTSEGGDRIVVSDFGTSGLFRGLSPTAKAALAERQPPPTRRVLSEQELLSSIEALLSATSSPSRR